MKKLGFESCNNLTKARWLGNSNLEGVGGGALMPSRSEQTKMVYYTVEIRDMRNILPLTPAKNPGECPRFSHGNNNRIFGSVPQ